jgi:hypothetical protein
VNEAFLLDEIIDDGAFAGAQCSCYSYDYHNGMMLLIPIGAVDGFPA